MRQEGLGKEKWLKMKSKKKKATKKAANKKKKRIKRGDKND